VSNVVHHPGIKNAHVLFKILVSIYFDGPFNTFCCLYK